MSFFLILLYTFFLAEEYFIIFMTRAFSANYIVLKTLITNPEILIIIFDFIIKISGFVIRTFLPLPR